MYFILLLLVKLCIIYNTSGLLSVISFIMWGINFVLSTFHLIRDPNNYLIRVVQIISLFQLLHILFIALKIIIFNIFI